MITKKDEVILSHLRNNARSKITGISRALGIPATTIYSKISTHEQNGVIKKHICLLDFSKVGYSTTAIFTLKAGSGNRTEIQSRISEYPAVNSLYRVNYGNDFVIEAVFKGYSEMHDFFEELKSIPGVADVQMFNVVEELAKEKFMSLPQK